jgi:hypothetical protein
VSRRSEKRAIGDLLSITAGWEFAIVPSVQQSDVSAFAFGHFLSAPELLFFWP